MLTAHRSLLLSIRTSIDVQLFRYQTRAVPLSYLLSKLSFAQEQWPRSLVVITSLRPTTSLSMYDHLGAQFVHVHTGGV